jgi:hypothetical protein
MPRESAHTISILKPVKLATHRGNSRILGQLQFLNQLKDLD